MTTTGSRWVKKSDRPIPAISPPTISAAGVAMMPYTMPVISVLESLDGTLPKAMGSEKEMVQPRVDASSTPEKIFCAGSVQRVSAIE